ncbi:Carbohydrate kinase [Entamoeba marina]
MSSNKFLLGFDIGSSSIKGSIVNEKGETLCSDYYPKEEMNIKVKEKGFAEQDVNEWITNLTKVTQSLLLHSNIGKESIKAIGITYQMHGLVMIDTFGNVLRDAIIWCDSRGVSYGEKAFTTLGKDYCLNHLLNAPGNFTLTKLAWVKEHEQEIYNKLDKILLPGDYIVFKLTGEKTTTLTGISEMMLFDYATEDLSYELLNFFGMDKSIIPTIVPMIGIQARLSTSGSELLGLEEGTPITYRAGDQPNYALSLNAFNPGEVVSTAGTSGVVYGILDTLKYDEQSRVNMFVHVNHTELEKRLGILLCINGTGCLYSWLKKLTNTSYEEMNSLAEKVPIGSDGIIVIPFGNGSERVLNNKDLQASFHGITFFQHTKEHLIRASQEGIVFSFAYGIDIIKSIGCKVNVIKAAKTNLFQSNIFCKTLSAVTGAKIMLYNTDGSVGAAKASGIGIGVFDGLNSICDHLELLEIIEIKENERKLYLQAYEKWLEQLETLKKQ